MGLILRQMLVFCGQSQSEMAYLDPACTDTEAQNAFIYSFLDTDEDQFNTVSIRLSVIETIEQLGIFDNTFFERFLENLEEVAGQPNLLVQTIEDMFSNWTEMANENKNLTVNMLSNMNSLDQVDVVSYLACSSFSTHDIQKDVALLMFGSFREYMPIDEAFVQNITEKLTSEGPLVAMRILWLLEKLCTLDDFF